MESGIGGLFSDEACEFGEQLTAIGACSPVDCGPTGTFSASQGHCVANQCPDYSNDFVPMWKHAYGDCVGDIDGDFEAKINEAISWLAQRVAPALLMVRLMRDTEDVMVVIDSQVISYAEYLWNYGFSPGLDGNIWLFSDPSMRGWLGPFGPDSSLKLEMLDEALTRCLCRCTWTDTNTLQTFSGAADAEDEFAVLHKPVIFRCWNGDVCGGAKAYVTGNIVNLCDEWRDTENAETRARTLLHELLHYSLEGWFHNFPNDQRQIGCTGGGLPDKCYGDEDALYLAQNLQLEDLAHNQGDLSNVWFKKAFRNIDNWRAWLAARFNAWGSCTVPVGAARP